MDPTNQCKWDMSEAQCYAPLVATGMAPHVSGGPNWAVNGHCLAIGPTGAGGFVNHQQGVYENENQTYENSIDAPLNPAIDWANDPKTTGDYNGPMPSDDEIKANYAPILARNHFHVCIDVRPDVDPTPADQATFL